MYLSPNASLDSNDKTLEDDTIVEVQEKESESDEAKLEDDLKPMVDKTEQEEILSDDMNELQNVTDAESEVPSMLLNREFEIRKESPSTVKIIRNDISTQMGTDVAESMGLEYPCVDSDLSDNAVVEEKPVIPEVTYDGDNDEENSDSEKSTKTNLPPPLPPSVGRDLCKDTSMDGERMNVSDDESIPPRSSIIAVTATVELKSQEEITGDDETEFKVKVPKYDENVSLMGVESDSVVELPDSGSDETVKTEYRGIDYTENQDSELRQNSENQQDSENQPELENQQDSELQPDSENLKDSENQQISESHQDSAQSQNEVLAPNSDPISSQEDLPNLEDHLFAPDENSIPEPGFDHSKFEVFNSFLEIEEPPVAEVTSEKEEEKSPEVEPPVQEPVRTVKN